jgi:dynein heavy chain
MIEKGKMHGNWVILENCHLCLSWMPRLEILVDQLAETDHPDFRLWMTSMPTPKFPVSVLQTSVKMTMEPPVSLKQNMMQLFDNVEDREFTKTSSPRTARDCITLLPSSTQFALKERNSALSAGTSDTHSLLKISVYLLSR